MSSTIGSSGSFDSLYAELLSLPPPLLPPGKSTDPSLTDQISSLYLHPTLEAAFHLLNADLPSAHFLVRHMQAAPAFEGMYLHGVLHRIEGDYDNARAWYGNVATSEVFGKNWKSKAEGLEFIRKVEALKQKGEGDKDALGEESVKEIKSIVGFCVEKFGKGKVNDATIAWEQPEGEHKRLGQDMISGDKGHRHF